MLDDDALTGAQQGRLHRHLHPARSARLLRGPWPALDYQIPQRARPVVEAVLAASERAGGRGPCWTCAAPTGSTPRCCATGSTWTTSRPGRRPGPRRAAADGGDRGRPAVLRRPAAPPGPDRARPRRLRSRPSTTRVAHRPARRRLGGGPGGRRPVARSWRAGIAGTGLVVCTGGVGYIGAPHVRPAAARHGRPAATCGWWCSCCGSSTTPRSPTTLAEYGLVTEQVEGTTFAQRRFADATSTAAADARRDPPRPGPDRPGGRRLVPRRLLRHPTGRRGGRDTRWPSCSPGSSARRPVARVGAARPQRVTRRRPRWSAPRHRARPAARRRGRRRRRRR